MATRSRALRFKLLAAFTLLVVVAWSVLWFVGATIVERQVDRALHSAIASGAVVDCASRTVTGFPFRIELRCGDGTHAATGAVDADISGLVVAALIYNPAQLIAEMQGPFKMTAAGAPTVEGDWDLARASARIDLGAQSVTRLDAEVVAGEFMIGSVPVRLREADVNLRQDPVDPGALNFHVKLDAMETGTADVPTTLTVQGTITGGAALLAGRAEETLSAIFLAGAPVVLDNVVIVHGEVALGANGAMALDANGYLSGSLDLALAGEDRVKSYLAAITPGDTSAITGLLENLFRNTPVTTEVAGHAAKEVSLTFDAGRVRVGAFPFPLPFQIPPLRTAAH